MHRCYPREAQIVIPILEEIERKLAAAFADVIVPMRAAVVVRSGGGMSLLRGRFARR
jgi:hypothetical protein